jgi:hypothetical protein
LHFVADRALADEDREPMQIFRVLAAEFDVLDDPDENFVTAFLKRRGIA